MIKRFFVPFAVGYAVVAFALGLAFSASAIAARGMDASPEAEGVITGEFPAHIHSGTCADLGDVVLPLNELTRAGAGEPVEATPVEGIATPPETIDATPEAMDSTGETTLIAASTTIVEASLDDILADEHAINVHESPEKMQNYIACGDLAGEPTDGELHIGLQELNDSGYSGEALLVDNGDGTTTVTVNLILGLTGTPEASPAA